MQHVVRGAPGTKRAHHEIEARDVSYAAGRYRVGGVHELMQAEWRMRPSIRASVMWGWKVRSSPGMPNARHPRATASASAINDGAGAIPNQTTRGRRQFGNAPTPWTSSDSGACAAVVAVERRPQSLHEALRLFPQECNRQVQLTGETQRTSGATERSGAVSTAHCTRS